MSCYPPQLEPQLTAILFPAGQQGYSAASLHGEIQSRPPSSRTNIQQVIGGPQTQVLNHHVGLIARSPAFANITAIANLVRYGLQNRRLCVKELFIEKGRLFFVRQASHHEITCTLD